jgi:hypothetical protein
MHFTHREYINVKQHSLFLCCFVNINSRIFINKFNPATYIEMPVPTLENERSRNMCVRCIDFTSVNDFSS